MTLHVGETPQPLQARTVSLYYPRHLQLKD